ncbi:MAG: PEGA domain-containing protein [Bacteroidales bacterium]|nr:PEGA domain-containing protein [Bacteroidales bacterium]
MKKLLVLLLFLVCVGTLSAQNVQDTKSLVLSRESFKLEQTDALSGVNIDPVGKDPSNRPCARIKLGINRMTPEEIAKVQVRIVGGNVVLTKRVPMLEKGGLELEMTARNVTFYLYHPVLGESNTVTVPLEGGQVYLMDAWAEQSHSMTVFCARGGAEVYLDGVYRGIIDNVEHTLTIPGIMAGRHHLKVSSGEDVTEQDIELSSAKVFFNVELKSTAHLQQFVIFKVDPADALIELEGETLVTNGGVAQKLMKFGTYSYSVMAKDYHVTRGQVTVNSTAAPKEVNVTLKPSFGWIDVSGKVSSGARVYIDNEYIGVAPVKSGKLSGGVHSVKIVKELYKTYDASITVQEGKVYELQPNLVSSAGNVTIKTTDPEAQVRINDEFKARGSWSGPLTPGSYRVEILRDKHVSVYDTFELKEGDDLDLSYPGPTPISGSLAVSSIPAGASLYIDDKLVGKTPYYSASILAGSHNIKITHVNYKDWQKRVDVEQNELTEVSATMIQGQSSLYNDYYNEEINTKPSKKGSYWRDFSKGYAGSVGYNIAQGYDATVLVINAFTSQGYRFSPYFYMGVNLGYNWTITSLTVSNPIVALDIRSSFAYGWLGHLFLGTRLGYPASDIYLGWSLCDISNMELSFSTMGIGFGLFFEW